MRYIVLITLFFIATSCNFENKTKIVENKAVEITNANKEVLNLLQQKCYACHSITSKSHDEIIAPPMVAVVKRYKMSYPTEQAFVEAVSNWVLNPTSENALMRGAVDKFNVMPKQPFNSDEITAIAQYMYSNELEAPVWFEDHFNQQHPNGMGMGQGKGNNRQ